MSFTDSVEQFGEHYYSDFGNKALNLWAVY